MVLEMIRHFRLFCSLNTWGLFDDCVALRLQVKASTKRIYAELFVVLCRLRKILRMSLY